MIKATSLLLVNLPELRACTECDMLILQEMFQGTGWVQKSWLSFLTLQPW